MPELNKKKLFITEKCPDTFIFCCIQICIRIHLHEIQSIGKSLESIRIDIQIYLKSIWIHEYTTWIFLNLYIFFCFQRHFFVWIV